MIELIFYLFYICITLFLRTIVHIKIFIADKIIVRIFNLINTLLFFFFNYPVNREIRRYVIFGKLLYLLAIILYTIVKPKSIISSNDFAQ